MQMSAPNDHINPFTHYGFAKLGLPFYMRFARGIYHIPNEIIDGFESKDILNIRVARYKSIIGRRRITDVLFDRKGDKDYIALFAHPCESRRDGSFSIIAGYPPDGPYFRTLLAGIGVTKFISVG